MNLQGYSQIFSIEKNDVQIYIDKGDTLVFMRYESAKILLKEVLQCEYTDSLLHTYEERDSINNNIIMFQKETIVKLSKKGENYEEIITNLKSISNNKDQEISLKDKTIKKQIRKIKRQKTLTTVGFTLAGVATVLVAILGIL
tara:strand:+ start:3233 stop:3661 length:429 start_codon:yes stop_codon:yes gene_type:complete